MKSANTKHSADIRSGGNARQAGRFTVGAAAALLALAPAGLQAQTGLNASEPTAVVTRASTPPPAVAAIDHELGGVLPDLVPDPSAPIEALIELRHSPEWRARSAVQVPQRFTIQDPSLGNAQREAIAEASQGAKVSVATPETGWDLVPHPFPGLR